MNAIFKYLKAQRWSADLCVAQRGERRVEEKLRGEGFPLRPRKNVSTARAAPISYFGRQRGPGAGENQAEADTLQTPSTVTLSDGSATLFRGVAAPGSPGYCSR